MTFWQGFWPWMTDHWFLGFLLAWTALVMTTVILKGLFRIFQRPRPKIEIKVQGNALKIEGDNSDAVVQTVMDILHNAAQKTLPRRSVWDRLREDDEDD